MFLLIDDYVKRFHALPSAEALHIESENAKLDEDQQQILEAYIDSLHVIENTSIDWLTEKTEDFCKEKALANAILKSAEILSGKEKTLDKHAISKLINDAIAVSFDTHIGHDYFDDAETRYEMYHAEQEKVPFDIDILNIITGGGVSRKTLTILMGGVHVGKTALMCSLAAANLRLGKNVLYISMEMSEIKIAHRIDAHLLDRTMSEVLEIDKTHFLNSVKRVKSLTAGRLKVREFPTSSAGVANFRYVLNELKLKENFVPDIVYVDYLNICNSSNFRQGKADLYSYVKAIGEELRGMAVEFNIPIITATQFNREGFASSDPGLENASESFGTTATGDLILGLVRNEELDKLKQIQIIQLKNRDSNTSNLKRFVVGIDIERMKLYNADDVRLTPRKKSSNDNDSSDDNFAAMFTEEMNDNMKFDRKMFAA